MDRRATISDVARLAGVSPTAVSFAFNNPAQLNGATVERIQQAAQHLGYSPNPHARALLSRRAGVIGVLVPQSIFAIFANPFYAAFLQGVGGFCDDEGLALLLASPLDGSLSEAVARAPVDGFIIVGLDEDHDDVKPLLKRRVPFVIVDSEARTVPSVNIDNEGGAYAAAADLLDSGHRDILIFALEQAAGVILGTGNSIRTQRQRGYQRAFADRGAAWRSDWMLSAVSSIDDGEQGFDAVWASGWRPTAVLAMSDAVAIGVVRGALDHGLVVPTDLEVIGFDDIPLASLLQPALTTVRQPIVEKGRLAAELLVASLRGETPPALAPMPTELIVRATTR